MRELRASEGILIFGAYIVLWTLLGAGLGRALSTRTLVLVTTFVPTGLAYLLLARITQDVPRSVGLARPRPKVILYAVIAALGLVVPAMTLESLVIFRFRPPKEMIDALTRLITARSVPELVYVMLVAAVGAAFCEEFVFRGILQRSLASMSAGWPSVVGASLVFGVLHDPWRLPAAFTLGFFLGALYLRTGTLLVPIVAHFTINAVAIMAAFTATKYGEARMPSWLREDTTAPFWLLGLSVVVFALAIRALWIESRPRPDATP